MAQLDLHGYVAPVDNFSGIYKNADTLERQKEKQDQINLQREGKKNAAGTFLNNYLDRKDFLTGTVYDPEITRQLNDAMMEGSKLAMQGADAPTLMMALGPKVNKIAEYASKAKFINQDLKAKLQQIPQNAGYDKQALENETLKTAFLDENGKLKDISTIDPQIDYLGQTISSKPELVTNDAGIDEFVKHSPKYVDTKDITTYTPSGAMTKKKVKVTSPDWLIPDVDQRGGVTGLTPRYQTALENGEPVMHNFTDEKGKSVSAPVRLLDEGLFNSILSQNHGIADWVRGQVKRANPQIDMNSAQAKNAARAILYDELKRRKSGGMEDVEVQNKPSTYEIKNYLGIGGGGASGLNVNDLYDRIESKINKDISNDVPTTRFNALDSDEQSVVMDAVNKVASKQGLDVSNLFLASKDGKIAVYKTGDNGERHTTAENLITTLPKTGVNLKAQPGVKEKRAVIQQGKEAEDGTINITDVPTGTKLEQKKGKYYYKGKEVKL